MHLLRAVDRVEDRVDRPRGEDGLLPPVVLAGEASRSPTDGDFILEWSADGQQIVTPLTERAELTEPDRGLLLWEIRDLLRQRRYMMLFYGIGR